MWFRYTCDATSVFHSVQQTETSQDKVLCCKCTYKEDKQTLKIGIITIVFRVICN